MNWKLSDHDLEVVINSYRELMLTADNPTIQRKYCELMTQAINRRSPEQVTRMERERGLSQ